jgi:hypothetical protein
MFLWIGEEKMGKGRGEEGEGALWIVKVSV